VSDDTTCGVRKASRFVFTRRSSVRRKRKPSTGTSLRNGTPDSLSRRESDRSPPMTMVWPFFAATTVLAERTVVVGPTSDGSPTTSVASGSMSDTSSKTVRRT
jgi:hypothetical protein